MGTRCWKRSRSTCTCTVSRAGIRRIPLAYRSLWAAELLNVLELCSGATKRCPATSDPEERPGILLPGHLRAAIPASLGRESQAQLRNHPFRLETASYVKYQHAGPPSPPSICGAGGRVSSDRHRRVAGGRRGAATKEQYDFSCAVCF